ncbi:MAG: hypothetical protein H0Z39_01035 [Peptococcaceae bacterium]|nr:hypothetical protein [Peptococcaceae bacterium]
MGFGCNKKYLAYWEQMNVAWCRLFGVVHPVCGLCRFKEWHQAGLTLQQMRERWLKAQEKAAKILTSKGEKLIKGGAESL